MRVQPSSSTASFVATSIMIGALAAGCGNTDIPQGEHGSTCITSEQCYVGLQCIAATCRPGPGVENEPAGLGDVGQACYANATCNPGGLCESGSCAACDDGSDGCSCFGNNTCNAGLACAGGTCSANITPGGERLPPANPACFSPCSSSFVREDGSSVTCSPAGLFEGCWTGRTCVQGSCVATLPSSSAPSSATSVVGASCTENAECGDHEICTDGACACQNDLACPDFQTCLQGSCYSNCDNDGECLAGEVCDRHVCRLQCDSANPCPSNNDYCSLPPAANSGVCKISPSTAATNPDAVEEENGPVQVPAFYLSERNLNFANTFTTSSFTIINDDILPRQYTVRKQAGDEIIEGRPLHWIEWGCTDGCNADESGTDVTDEFAITLEAGGVAQISLSGTDIDQLPNWSGRIVVLAASGGERAVTLSYTERPEGRWEGQMFYFANFPDRCLYAETFQGGSCAGWVNNKDDAIEQDKLNNAFIRKWVEFVDGSMSLDEFQALVQSTQSQSWRSPLMQEFCSANPNSACYPYDNANGFSVYSGALDTYQIPSGNFELPIAMNLAVDDTDASKLYGRVVSSSAMQYAGDPAVTMELETAPADCTVNARGVTLCRVTDLQLQVLTGGRQVVPESLLPSQLAFIADAVRPPCTDYVTGSDPNYKLYYEPWLIPGFENGTKYDETSGLRYRFECRDSRLPLFMDGVTPTDDEIALNLSLAQANAIPDGRTRVRNIRLIDGVLINQRDLVIIFQEEFDSFLGDTDGTFSAYGIMQLTRNAVQLDDDAFVGNDPLMTPVGGDVAGPSCAANMLAGIEDDTGLDFSAVETNAADAANLAELMIFGQTAPPSAVVYNIADNPTPVPPVSGTLDAEHVHWWCSSTDLIDGGKDKEIACPGAAQARFFTITADVDLLTEDDLRLEACNTVTDISISINPSLELKRCNAGEEGCNCIDDPSKCTTCSSFSDGNSARPCTPVRSDVQTDFYTVNNLDFIPGNCLATIEGWAQDDQVGNADGVRVRWDPSYRCAEVDGSRPDFCAFSLDTIGRPIVDERTAKDFYLASSTEAAFTPLRSEIVDAFRYKTQFRSRSGKNVGFAPELCISGSDQIPFCYDAELIEEVEERVDCLAHLYDTHLQSDAWDAAESDLGGRKPKDVVRAYLEDNFAVEIITVNPADGRVMAVPVINEGFERLYAELLVMMGDESFTKAFASRFDLAGGSILSFQGTLFEPGGFDLSGGAGFEMYVLYQSVQYYQKALDRFYGNAPFIWRSVSEFGDTTADGFIGAETVTTYLERLIRASTQKARANSEIAQKYADFNEPELARRVIERGYTAAYLESVILSRMMLRLLDQDVVGTSGPQILKTVEKAQLTYRSALLRMANVYSNITDNPNFFGYAPNYIPFPTLDIGTEAEGNTNAFEVLRDIVREQIDVAAEKEDSALEQNRSYETDAAAFQAELVSIKNNYENQLVGLCGTFQGTDGTVYPAIERYSYLHPTPAIGDPCGRNNGALSDALTDLGVSMLDQESSQQALIDHKVRLQIIKDQVQTQCQLINNIADYTFEAQQDINAYSTAVSGIQSVLNQADRTNDQVYNLLALISQGDGPIGSGKAIVASTGYAAGLIAYNVITIAGEIAVTALEAKVRDGENDLGRWTTERECDFALIEANAATKELLLEGFHLEIAFHQQQLIVASTIGTIEGYYREARRIQAEQEEAQQLSINIEAARNDPNVRIYKNDAILTADRTFERALATAYRLTKMYEYYTSQSYAFFGDLFLVRLVKRGDISLEQYVDEIEDAFFGFEETFGLPDNRVMVLSARDDILGIPMTDPTGGALSESERNQRFRDELFDPSRINEDLYISLPFAIRLDQLSPVTTNHKIFGVEVEIIGADEDDLFRVYLRQRGTSVVRAVDGDKIYYGFPKKTAVVNASFAGERVFDEAIYRNFKLRDRPLSNTHYELLLNLYDEPDNLDLRPETISDIRVVIYYSDFSDL